MKKKQVDNESDEFDADEPEDFEESGSDYEPEPETAKKRKGRAPAKASKKPTPSKKKKVAKPPSDEEEEEEEDEEGEETDESESDAVGAATNGDDLKAFANGSFVVLKTDLEADGNPSLWKIDGKALLQKFIPFEQDGKTLYKNTSTYSGWTQNNRDQYAAAPVTFVVQGKKEIILEFNRDKVVLDKKDGKEEATADA